MDIVFIEDLQIEAVIGIYDWERTTRQIVSLDIEMASHCAMAAATDRVRDTIDYNKVARRLVEFVGQSQVHLVETLAEQIAVLLMAEFGAPWVRIKVSKPGALSNAKAVGILIERGQK